MGYLIVSLTAFLVSLTTLFSGFGLGTVLLPVLALFFALPVAIVTTAVVHLANNLFKTLLVGSSANWSIVLKFGLPAMFASALGAYMMGKVSNLPAVMTYQIFHHEFQITILGFLIGLIVITSSLFELIPQLSKLTFSAKLIPLGGIFSGFFGGISGHQGMLRSAFLIKAGLSKEAFIGTSVILSVIVDIIRLFVYAWTFYDNTLALSVTPETVRIASAACLSAFLGSYIGAKLIPKVTFRMVQTIVGVLLCILGMGIALGIL